MKHRKNKSHTVIQYLITTVFFAKQAKKCLHFPGNLIESMLESDRINVKLFLRCGQMFAEKRRVFCLNGHGTGT